MTEDKDNAVDTGDEKTCAGCLNQLLDEHFISALGQEWHMECFRCSACDVALSSWYFEKEGLLFCQADYLTRYGESCQQCTQIITGPVMAAGDHRFHPECFCCELCTKFIGDGEAYALIERSKLYCGVCYERVMRPLGRGRHAIQLVEIPPRSPNRPQAPPVLCLAPDPRRGLTIKQLLYAIRGKLASLARSLLRAALSLCIRITEYSVDVSCGLMALHIGDRILEINGTPVKDQPISQIENLICYSDTVLQLTIEHDPDTLKSDSPAIPSYDTVDRATDVDMRCDSCTIPEITLTPEQISEDKSCESSPDDYSKKLLNITLGGRERPFRKRADDGIIANGIRAKQFRRKARCSLGDKERSSSMSQLVDNSVCKHESCEDGVLNDLSRTRSFRIDARPPPTVFRATDLLQGELLGSGFFGQVFKVTHKDTNEVMVLKQLYRVDEDAQNNFLKEVAVLRSLSHPNVLRFVGVLYKEQRLHLVTEYIGGGTLRALLEGSRIPPWAERAGYARDIASGLSYLHRKNIIHRDLNSHNCLVKEDKTVIVADFGLARIVKRTGVSGSLERSKQGSARERKKRYTVVGNPYWMAPEMMKGNVYDERVDVFSYGIVLCEIIGRVHADPDFLPRSADFGLNQSLFKEKFCDGCPEPFYNIAFLCCNLNPDKRPPFEVIEVWLESLNLHLSTQQMLPYNLLRDIKRYGNAEATDELTEKNELKKSNSGNILDNISYKTRLGPKCISTSHLCRPNEPIFKCSLSKSQNALSSTPAGYILSTDDKTISITKVDDVREWLDEPLILRRIKTDDNPTADPGYRKSKKFDGGKYNKSRILKSQSANCNINLVFKDKEMPCYLRNQSLHEMEVDDKIVDTFQRYSSDSDDEVKCSIDLKFPQSKSYDVNPEPVKKTDSNVEQLRRSFEANSEPEKSKGFNGFKFSKRPIKTNPLTKIFHSNPDPNPKIKDCKNSKCKSTFFVSKPESDASGKCPTPVLKRHGRVDDSFGSVGRFSYREKSSKSPLVRCNNFKNIPSLTYDPTANGNYVSLANLRIDCSALGESIVKRNITKFNARSSTPVTAYLDNK